MKTQRFQTDGTYLDELVAVELFAAEGRSDIGPTVIRTAYNGQRHRNHGGKKVALRIGFL